MRKTPSADTFRRRVLCLLTCACFCRLHAVSAQQENRSPSFLSDGDMSRFSLREDTPVGSAVYTLRARDPENGTVEYSISGDHLSVHRTTGIVTLVRPLDREKEDVLRVIVSITGEPVRRPSPRDVTNSTRVSDNAVNGPDPNVVSLRREIRVEDVNDNFPAFLGVPFTVKVPEDAPVGTTLFRGIKVSDADAGANAELQLRCDEEKVTYARCSPGRLIDPLFCRTKTLARPSRRGWFGVATGRFTASSSSAASWTTRHGRRTTFP